MFETLQKRILLDVPLCPAGFVLAYLSNAATDFFRDSGVWQYEFEDINLVEDQAAYTLTFPGAWGDNADIWRIIEAKHSGVLIPVGQYKLEETESGSVWTYQFTYLDDYIPTADEEDALDVKVVMAPFGLDGYVPDFEWSKWQKAVMWGALAAMYAARTRPWYDPVAADHARLEYDTQLALAHKEREQQFTADSELRAVNPEGWL